MARNRAPLAPSNAPIDLTGDADAMVMSEKAAEKKRANAGADEAECKKAKTAPAPAAGGAAGLQKLLGDKFVTSDGKTPTDVETIAKDADLIGIYWSAHWCGPCRGFTPKLVTFVEMLEEEGVNFPVIFASGDKSKEEFAKYFASFAGPQWSAFPALDKRITALKKKYGVKGIPWLVVLDKQGNLICNEADAVVPKGPSVFNDWLKVAKAKA